MFLSNCLIVYALTSRLKYFDILAMSFLKLVLRFCNKWYEQTQCGAFGNTIFDPLSMLGCRSKTTTMLGLSPKASLNLLKNHSHDSLSSLSTTENPSGKIFPAVFLFIRKTTYL